MIQNKKKMRICDLTQTTHNCISGHSSHSAHTPLTLHTRTQTHTHTHTHTHTQRERERARESECERKRERERQGERNREKHSEIVHSTDFRQHNRTSLPDFPIIV